MIKVALVDDHKLFREGIRFLLEQMLDVTFLFEASGGKQLLEKMETQEPDILLLDLDMPSPDGVEILKQLRPEFPSLGIIILTIHADRKMIAYLMELGANSYLLKDSDPKELEEAIKAVYNEGHYFTNKVSQAMLTGLKGHFRKRPNLNGNITLSQREVEVLELICLGDTAKEIADKLFISVRTAEGHRRRLIEKLGVKNTASLITKAIKEKLVDV